MSHGRYQPELSVQHVTGYCSEMSTVIVTLLSIYLNILFAFTDMESVTHPRVHDDIIKYWHIILSGNPISHFTQLNETAGGPVTAVTQFFVSRCPRVLVKRVAFRRRILSN
jgi:hypothetical protein